MNVQHVNVKIFALEPEAIDLGDSIGVFHGWIRDKLVPELLVDVADYRHVPDGPGVMLIAHEAHYALDTAEGRLGLLYNRKESEDGTTAQKLRQAYEAALAATKRLEQAPPFRGKLKFDPHGCEVIFNDRLLTPNDEETRQTLAPEVKAFFAELWSDDAVEVEPVGEPRDRLRFRVRRQSLASRPA